MPYPEVTRKLEAAARARHRNRIIRGMTLQEKAGVLGDACQLLGCQLSSHFRNSNATYTRRVKL